MPDQQPSRVLVIGPAGLQKWVDPGELGRLREGFKQATPEQQRQAWLDWKYSGAGGTAKKALAVADEAVLNLGSATAATVAEALGADETAAGVRNVKRELTEQIGPGGQLLGAGIGLVSSGGLGGLSGGRAALRGLGGAERAINVAGHAVERAAANRGVGALGQAALRAGTEGAMVGGAHAMTEAALGNAGLTAESVAADVLGGAVVGGALGAGVSKLGQKLTQGGQRLKGAMARPRARDLQRLGEGVVGDKLKPGVASSLASTLSSAKADDISSLAGSAERRAAAVYGADEAVERAVSSLVEGGDGVIRAQDILRRLQQDAKPGALAPYVDSAKAAEQYALSRALHQEVGAALREIQKNKFNFGTRKVKELEQRIARNVDMIDDAVKRGGDDLANRLRTITERTKKDLDLVSATWRKSRAGKYEEKLAAKHLQPTIEKFRKGLEDSDVWGDVGRIHAAHNKATAEGLESRQYFDRKLTGSIGRDTEDPYLRGRSMDRSKVTAAIKGVSEQEGNLTRRAVMEQLDTTEAGVDVALEHFRHVLSADDVQALKRARSGIDKARSGILETADKLDAAAQLKAIDDAQNRGPGAIVAGLLGAGGAYGALEGDPTMAGVGLAGAALTRPGMAIRQLAALERLAGSATRRIGQRSSSFFGRATQAARYGVPRMGSLAWYDVKDDDVTDSRRLAYERRADTLRKTTDEALRSGMGEAMAPVASTAPGVTEAAKQATQRAAQHLRDALPTGSVPVALLGERPMPSNAELSKFARKLAVVEDPLGTVFDAMDDGTLTRDHMETIRAVYPETYQQIVDTMLDRVQDLQENGKTLPYRDHLQLTKLLGVPTHGTLRPEVMAAIQQGYAAPPQQAQQQPGKSPPKTEVPDLASAFRTDSEETASDDEES